jgi:hypothetical protein
MILTPQNPTIDLEKEIINNPDNKLLLKNILGELQKKPYIRNKELEDKILKKLKHQSKEQIRYHMLDQSLEELGLVSHRLILTKAGKDFLNKLKN